MRKGIEPQTQPRRDPVRPDERSGDPADLRLARRSATRQTHVLEAPFWQSKQWPGSIPINQGTETFQRSTPIKQACIVLKRCVSVCPIPTSNGCATMELATWIVCLLAVCCVARGAGVVDLGPNVIVFDPGMDQKLIQEKCDALFTKQFSNQFGSERYAVFFKPGTYKADITVGFYTHIAGLGKSPTEVTLKANCGRGRLNRTPTSRRISGARAKTSPSTRRSGKTSRGPSRRRRRCGGCTS